MAVAGTLPATARSYDTLSEWSASDDRRRAAVALAQPCFLPIAHSFGHCDDNQSPKTLPGNVFEGTHTKPY